jgi:hypothetical protein
MLKEYLELWNALDEKRLDATFSRWFALVLKLINDHRSYSHAVAARYMAEMRARANLEPSPPAPLRPLNPRLVEQHMLAETVVPIKKAMKVKPLQQAVERGFIDSAGAATRLIMAPGRDAVVDQVNADKEAIGWYRICDPDPCWFCAMLASAGVHYKSQETAGFRAHYHCGCGAAAMYDRSDSLPDQNRSFARQWKAATRGKKGKNATLAFRRAYEGR